MRKLLLFFAVFTLLVIISVSCSKKKIKADIVFVLADSTSVAYNDEKSIDTTPSMPKRSSFDLKPNPPVPITVHEIQYKLRISYNENGRNDQSQEITGSILNNTCCINYGNVLMGNQLSGQANILFTARGRRQWTGWQTIPPAFIPAINPSKAGIRNYINDLSVSIVAFKSSVFEMFGADGKPHYANGGFGLFELKTISDPEQIWHWKKNCDAGKTDYIARLDKARLRPAGLRQSNPQMYAGLPDFNPAQLKLETWQSYAGENYWEPVKVGAAWRWRAIAARKPFADECAAVEKQVNTGNPPAGWD